MERAAGGAGVGRDLGWGLAAPSGALTDLVDSGGHR